MFMGNRDLGMTFFDSLGQIFRWKPTKMILKLNSFDFVILTDIIKLFSNRCSSLTVLLILEKTCWVESRVVVFRTTALVRGTEKRRLILQWESAS